MRILVTGGTGFIGQALCTALLENGHEVTVLSRRPEHARQQDTRLESVKDTSDISAKRRPEAIVNLAGQNLGSGRWNATRKREFIDSRVEVTRHIVEYIAGATSKPAVLVNGSAVGYYGARGGERLAEDAEPGEEYQSELCKQWEAEARRAEEHGVRVCRIRIGAVLDGDGGPLSSMLPPFRWGLGGYFGDGRQWLSWIHRQDLVAIMLTLIQNPKLSGAFNATAPYPETNRVFSRKLGAALHRPVLLRFPGWAVRVGAGEMAWLFLTGQRVIPERLGEAGFTFRYPRLEDAFRQILE